MKNEGKLLTWRGFRMAVADIVPLFIAYFGIAYLSPSFLDRPSVKIIFHIVLLCAVLLYSFRLLFRVYNQIWRFGNVPAFIRLILAEFISAVIFISIVRHFPILSLRFIQQLGIFAIDLLLCITMRLFYAYCYQNVDYSKGIGRIAAPFVRLLTGLKVSSEESGRAKSKTRIAIVGAGRMGSKLADELMSNKESPYQPICFFDNDPTKIGRVFNDIPVHSDSNALNVLKDLSIQIVVLALPDLSHDDKMAVYNRYKESGCRVITYDYPELSSRDETNKPVLREVNIEDLLFRSTKEFINDTTRSFYENKTVLVSGGGGSIGSELCRQIARMNPKKLVILDIYENNAYDIQQELRINYGATLDLAVEIFSVTDKVQLEGLFEKYRPDVVLHAAAHKHVPLMEHNVWEAVYNNVFGTLNMVTMAERYGVKKFIMISTDKAVNPTNVMGATKRMCEMIVLSHAGTEGNDTSFSCTRFGNVLGSNGSVIPLFKRQIAKGGPVTVTDKRIIRYFMTIPEASQLVLTSGAIAKNGELFVLDMGNPVKIYDLAENMIRLTGLTPGKDIEIVETGLRPGEKLYEELLIKSENLDKTDNDLIFVERQNPLSRAEVEEKLKLLQDALDSDNNDTVRAALHQVVPTFKTPEEVNALAEKAEEMKINN